MATNSSAIRGVATFPKRFVNHLRPRDPPSAPLFSSRGMQVSKTCRFHAFFNQQSYYILQSHWRNVHASVYDKNADEHVCPALVPDDIVQQKSEYWAPNPHTGVFGPAAEASPVGSAESVGNSESVLEQKTFYRAVENLDKPQHP